MGEGMSVLTLKRCLLYKKAFAPKGWWGYAGRAWERAWGFGYFYHPSLYPIRKCVVCGRQRDSLFHFTSLVSILGDVEPVEDGFVWHHMKSELTDVANGPDDCIREICLDHRDITGPEIWDCTTGLSVSVPPRKSKMCYALRNLAQQILLKCAFAIRFAYFLLYSWLRWNVVGPVKAFLRTPNEIERMRE